MFSKTTSRYVAKYPSPCSGTANGVSRQSAFWPIIVCILAVMLHNTGRVWGHRYEYSFVLKSSILVCLFDTIQMLIEFTWLLWVGCTMKVAAQHVWWWRVKKEGAMDWIGTREGTNIVETVKSFTHLESLSVFVQGPLASGDAYQQVCWKMSDIYGNLKKLRFMVVKLPRPFRDEVVQLRARHDEKDPVEQVNRVVQREEELHEYRIDQPHLGSEEDVYSTADLDMETRWRIGTIYMESSGDRDGVATRNYAMLRPEKEAKTSRPGSPHSYFQVPAVEQRTTNDLYGSKYRALNWPPRLDGQA